MLAEPRDPLADLRRWMRSSAAIASSFSPCPSRSIQSSVSLAFSPSGNDSRPSASGLERCAGRWQLSRWRALAALRDRRAGDDRRSCYVRCKDPSSKLVGILRRVRSDASASANVDCTRSSTSDDGARRRIMSRSDWRREGPARPAAVRERSRGMHGVGGQGRGRGRGQRASRRSQSLSREAPQSVTHYFLSAARIASRLVFTRCRRRGCWPMRDDLLRDRCWR